jgi:hypothetical protein
MPKTKISDWDPYQHLMALEQSARVAEENIKNLAQAHNTMQDQVTEIHQMTILLKDCIVQLRKDQHKIEQLYQKLNEKIKAQ